MKRFKLSQKIGLIVFICTYVWIAFLLLPSNIESITIKNSIANGKPLNPPPSISSTISTPLPTSTPIPNEPPVNVSIPSVGINAQVLPTGNTPDGSTMEVPYIFDKSFWYQFSSLPGTIGNTIIAGHLDGYNSTPAVFWNLNHVNIDDKIIITTPDQTLTYTVTNKQIVGLNDTASWIQIMSSRSNNKTLTLITCSGDWIPSMRTRTDRVVITANI